MVNVIFYGRLHAGEREWVLIDTGVIGTKAVIKSAAEARIGEARDLEPSSSTHGHFDHVGALEDLAEKWDVPVYAHDVEHTYLNGRAAYPPEIHPWAAASWRPCPPSTDSSGGRDAPV